MRLPPAPCHARRYTRSSVKSSPAISEGEQAQGRSSSSIRPEQDCKTSPPLSRLTGRQSTPRLNPSLSVSDVSRILNRGKLHTPRRTHERGLLSSQHRSIEAVNAKT